MYMYKALHTYYHQPGQVSVFTFHAYANQPYWLYSASYNAACQTQRQTDVKTDVNNCLPITNKHIYTWPLK